MSARDQRTLTDLATGAAALALASFPFESARLAFPLGPLTVTIPEALIAVTVAATAIALVRIGPRLLDAPFVLAAGSFVLALLVSAALAPEHGGNAVKFALRSSAGVAFGLSVCALTRERPARALTLLGSFAGGVLVSALLGLAESVAGDHIEPFLSVFRESAIYVAGFRRVTSTFEYPNILAAAVAVSFPTVAAVWEMRGGWRVAAIVAGLVFAPVLVLTYSRGGLVAAAIGLVVLLAISARPLQLPAVARGAAIALATLGAVWGVFLANDALLARRATGLEAERLLDARYVVQAPGSSIAPGETGLMRVEVTNAGSLAWTSTPEHPFRLTSSWSDREGRPIVLEGPRTDLPAVVRPGETVSVEAAFEAPQTEGAVWLEWDVLVEHRLRMSEHGVVPGYVSVLLAREPTSVLPMAARPPREPEVRSTGFVSPPRRELWRAALAMLRERPVLGFGPDSYRLTYGRYLDLHEWDQRVFANNVALEFLATTGLLGTAAFLAVLLVVGWRACTALRTPPQSSRVRAAVAAAIAGLVVWSAHGVVDYFMEATVGYGAYWMLCGVVVALAQPRAGADSETEAL